MFPGMYGNLKFHDNTQQIQPRISSISIQSIHTHSIYWRSVLFLSSHLRLGHPITPSNPVESPPSPTISPYHDHLISLDRLPSIVWWWVPILKMHVLLFHPLVCYLVNYRLISWTPYSEDPLFHVPPLISVNMFHVPPNQKAEWHSCTFYTSLLWMAAWNIKASGTKRIP
jgi:hypothetical protein